MSELIHVTATTDELIGEAVELSEQRAQPYLTETRKAQITQKMNRIFFEIHEREGAVILDEVIPA